VNQALQEVTNFSAIDDLMKVHQGQKTKQEVFQKHEGELKKIFAEMEPLEKQRMEQFQVITNNIGGLGEILSKMSADPRKTEFFGRIDTAIAAYTEISNMMH